jgi:exonuclease SbcD
VSIDGAASLDEFSDRLFGAIDAASGAAEGRALLCRVAIRGRGPLHRDLARDASARELLARVRDRYVRSSPFVWVEELTIACQPEIDLEERSRAEDLLAQVLRASGEIRQGDEFLERLYAEALSRLFENTRAEKALEPLSREEKLRLLEDAELLCVDRLENAL